MALYFDLFDIQWQNGIGISHYLIFLHRDTPSKPFIHNVLGDSYMYDINDIIT